MATNTSSSLLKFAMRRRDPDPKSAALLVIDMQNYFAAMAGPIVPPIRATIDYCRSAGVPVIFTRHCHRSPEDHGMLDEWWDGDLIFDGTPESRLMPEMGRRDDEPVVEKHTYSGFQGTGLEAMLKKMGRSEVIVTGVMTNLCCETTARDAFVKGFRVFFSVDATATESREMQEATLLNLGYGFAYLIDCQGLKRALAEF
ncbi:unnamed protein product [Victoria cruziana]